MNDKVTSVAHIPLPISVQAQIKDRHDIACNDDCSCMCYVNLTGVVDDYEMIKKQSQFEVV